MAPASGARAWTPIAGQRPVWCKSVPYAMNSVGSADLGANTSQSETQRAFTDWTKAECADLPVQWNGTTASKPVTNDGNSIVGWIESGWPEEPAAIGVTGPIWTFTPSTGAYCIVEADMMLNGVNYLWTTQPGNGTTVNAYSILLHESGHYYGLGHSQTPSATMYFAYDGGVDSLQADDKNGICALYPGGSGVDCTTTGCPGGQQCVAGSCQKVIGDGSVCSVCSMDSDCGGANDYCLMYPDGGTYCGKACSNDADCEGENDRCVRTSGTSSQCARFDESAHPDCASSQTNEGCMFDSDCEATQLCDATTKACKARPTTGAALGAGCATAEACTTQLCLTSTDGGICSMTCDWLDASSCPTGFYCNATVTGTCGTGLCLAGSAGATAAGGQCQKDTDCST
ncbi:MAG: matrixin family metalloprotease, partial [Myxococcales bacterium]|nr:matrixin family metalloprotease [Myxococcales bacterium]